MFSEKTLICYADFRCLPQDEKYKRAEDLKDLVSQQRWELYEKNGSFARLAAGAMLTLVLNRFGIDYLSQQTYKTEFGKEYFENKNVFYNISHSKNIACCAVSTQDIGIDCEEISAVRNCFQIAERFFSHEECEYLKSLDDSKGEFAKIWTMKESYVKYTSNGFSIPISSVVCIPNGGIYRINGANIKTYDVEGGYISVCNKSRIFPENITDITQFFF